MWPVWTAKEQRISTPRSLQQPTTPLQLAFKSALLKPFWEFRGFWARATHILAWPCSKLFSAPNSDVLVCLASLRIGHTNLCSVTFGYLKLNNNFKRVLVNKYLKRNRIQSPSWESPFQILRHLSPVVETNSHHWVCYYGKLILAMHKTKDRVKLTLEQYGFELYGSTYTQIFFKSKYYSTTQSEVGWIHECGGTMDMEVWLQSD